MDRTSFYSCSSILVPSGETLGGLPSTGFGYALFVFVLSVFVSYVVRLMKDLVRITTMIEPHGNYRHGYSQAEGVHHAIR